MALLTNWFVSALAILAAAYLIPGIHVANIQTALLAALVLGILNAIVKPVLFILTLPITIVTLGLFTFVLNALIILFASKLISGFIVDGFLPALLFSIVVSLISSVLHHIIK